LDTWDAGHLAGLIVVEMKSIAFDTNITHQPRTLSGAPRNDYSETNVKFAAYYIQIT
jgi:hypothetical protein